MGEGQTTVTYQCPHCGIEGDPSEFTPIQPEKVECNHCGGIIHESKIYRIQRNFDGPDCVVEEVNKPPQNAIAYKCSRCNGTKVYFHGAKLPKHCPYCQCEWIHDDKTHYAEDQPVPSQPSQKDYEYIDHPPHYGGDVPYEVKKVLRAWEVNKPNIWNAIKYLARAGKKPQEEELKDLKKALWYIQDEIRFIETGEL